MHRSRSASTQSVVTLASGAILAACLASALQAQEPQSQPVTMLDWQVAAGGRAEFDVASVKRDTSGPPPSGTAPSSNVPLGPFDSFTPTGGLLSATNYPLAQYMMFAYKLAANQYASMVSQLPKWATTERFDIQARAEGNPTKDQFRLMMQALLKDRFKLTIHYETNQQSVFALVVETAGKLGPRLVLHPADSPCSESPSGTVSNSGSPKASDSFPKSCGSFAVVNSDTAPGRLRIGGQNIPIAMIASLFPNPLTGVDRPVIDKTGLSGKFDIGFEFAPEVDARVPLDSGFQPDDSGPTFLQALRQQLGLKLEPAKGPVEVLVIDHIEEPSEN